MFQSVGDGITVLYARAEQGRPGRGRRRRGPAAGTGSDPDLVPDFIALRGDPSDGLPGGKGIGEKTAADLLRRHGSLEGAIAAALGETPRIRGTLRDQADELRAFRDIATLRRVEVELPPDAGLDRDAAAAAAARRAG